MNRDRLICDVRIKFIPLQLRRVFKGFCALREIPVSEAFSEGLRLVVMGKFYLDADFEMPAKYGGKPTSLYIRRMPRAVRTAFVAKCRLEEIYLHNAYVQVMRGIVDGAISMNRILPKEDKVVMMQDIPRKGV